MSNWKLVSLAKVAADQAKAQLSTGPKSQEGKARSAQYSLKHGLSSTEVFVKPEEKDLFRQFRHDYMADHPDGRRQPRHSRFRTESRARPRGFPCQAPERSQHRMRLSRCTSQHANLPTGRQVYPAKSYAV